MSYYDNGQWSASAQSGWDHQTPPPGRSGASSAIPQEPAAFSQQLDEVDRAIENLVKSGKMFGMTGGRREFLPPFLPGPARIYPDFDPRGHGGPQRPHSMTDFGDPRGAHPSSNLQNFYANQRHQSSRGSNEAEQMMQAKRRMAAQRERELRNYHQEQQFNRNGLVDLGYGPGNPGKPDRTLSPGGMSEAERRELIARQRSALYGEGPFAETGGYIDETGTPRPGLPGHQQHGPAGLRGSSPLALEYGRTPPVHPDAGPQSAIEPSSAGPNQRSRTSSNASPQSNPSGSKGPYDGPAAQQASRTSNSSPGGSPSNGKPTSGATVAPIGTRPSATATSQGPPNPALSKRSTTPLPSPLSQGYSASSNADAASQSNSNPQSASAEGPVGLAGSGWGQRSGVWGQKSSLGVQASVWG